MHPTIDTRMEPIEFFVEAPYTFKFAGKEFSFDTSMEVSKKCNELGLNGVRVTKISVSPGFKRVGNAGETMMTLYGYNVMLDVEAAR
jgi:hypothetical protein